MMPMLMPAARAAAWGGFELRAGDEPLHPRVELGLRGEVAAPHPPVPRTAGRAGEAGQAR